MEKELKNEELNSHKNSIKEKEINKRENDDSISSDDYEIIGMQEDF